MDNSLLVVRDINHKYIVVERRFNGYGIGDYTACYLTQKEFFLAITYLNVKKQRDLGNQKKMDIDM